MADLTTLLERLHDAGVEFVLVGGLAAVSQGAPVTTFDVDIVHRIDPENVSRLLVLLDSLNARHRGQGDRVLRPNSRDLSAGGHCLLMTDLGALDVLGRIEGGRKYEDLVDHARDIQFRGRTMKVLDLSLLVELKRESKQPEDRQRLTILEATLRRRGDR
ncbi:MAG: hypothetical protein A2289_11170 [Deltaproteobacteria bacterium RIFOXYA12_FULL_58_15]|nr:MAG: hypothetical protein A2289_11170 [Deltaproteobacteria bacterium RIFOXYA12_FULL_58_15]